VSPATCFTDPAAVEAWDRWFRWRDDGGLRDLTVDATWRRVADAIAGAEGAAAPSWSRRFIEAFSRWQLLPDARLLHLAGTGDKVDDLGDPAAVLNAAAFVRWPDTPRATFDRENFVATAALAVRLLDDVLLSCSVVSAGTQPRLGLIGVADALQMLGLPYDSAGARQCAAGMASALAEGALLGATDLARERGSADCDRQKLAQRWRGVGAPRALIEAVLRWGMRYSGLTRIEPQPQLALLANDASDALDPRLADTGLPTRRPAYEEDDAGRSATAETLIRAQIELRAEMQPWIDTPIDYPLAFSIAPDPAALELSGRLASQHGLQPLTLRRARALQLINNEVDGKA